VFIAKRFEHLHAVVIFNVHSGNLNAIAVFDLGSFDIATLFFHPSHLLSYATVLQQSNSSGKKNYLRKFFMESSTISFTLQRKV